MKGMKRLTLPIVSILLVSNLTAQEVQFDQGHWRVTNPKYQRRTIVVAENGERIDSIYTENVSTGELELVIQKYPLARYEYYPTNDLFPPLLRRMDIRQETRYDSTLALVNGKWEFEPTLYIIDIPNGAYHEFFPNGNIRIKGTLDGYNLDGTLKKTGTWMEWDAGGNVIREEHYP